MNGYCAAITFRKRRGHPFGYLNDAVFLIAGCDRLKQAIGPAAQGDKSLHAVNETSFGQAQGVAK